MNIIDIIGKIMVAMDEVETSSLLANSADYINKIYPLIDSIQTEIATTVKPIKKYITLDSVNKKIEEPADCYEFLKVYDTDMSPINFLHFNKTIHLIDEDEDGTFTLYYNKYPLSIDKDTPNNYQLEIDKECQEALVYGVAAGLCINDEPELYQDYAARYKEMLTNILANIQNKPVARLVGGLRI